jgi:hypothetical protein
VLGLVEAACLVLVLLCLGFHQRSAATEVVHFTIWGRITAVAVAVLLLQQVRTGHLAKEEEEGQHRQQAAETDLLVQRRHRHKLVSRIQVAEVEEAKMPLLDSVERQVVRA